MVLVMLNETQKLEKQTLTTKISPHNYGKKYFSKKTMEKGVFFSPKYYGNNLIFNKDIFKLFLML